MQSMAIGIGTLYICTGLIGCALNTITMLMIAFRRVYRLSAYTLMANVALADAMMMLMAGVACGIGILVEEQDRFGVINANESGPSPMALYLRQSENRLEHDENIVPFWPPNALINKHQNDLARKMFNKEAPTSNQDSNASETNETSSNERKKKRILRGKAIIPKKRYNNKRILEPRSAIAKRIPPIINGTYESAIRVIIEPLLAAKNPNPDTTHGNPSTSFLVRSSLAFFATAAWTAGVCSYAFLGVNRCVAIRFYGTKAKLFNRVSVALASSAISWVVGVCVACVGTFPTPLVGIRTDMWSIGPEAIVHGQRFMLFTSLCLLVNSLSVAIQWVCSILVLHKIHQVKKKINRNKLNQDSANRFHRQARLTFQFFYPSLFCTVSSFLYFAKPFIHRQFGALDHGHFIALHMLWLANHFCNPLIYAYFNERMRATYKELLTCAPLRLAILRRRRKYFDDRSTFGHTRRSTRRRRSSTPGVHRRTSTRRRTSPRSAPENTSTQVIGCRGHRPSSAGTNGFIRNSLQMQSRDFEQLCEFIMRVNPLYDSSEGWCESSCTESEEEEGFCTKTVKDKEQQQKSRSEGGLLSAVDAAHGPAEPRGPSRSVILLEVGRDAVEHWARFAKKASI